MTNIVMIVRDRPRLVYQSLWTLMNHSYLDYTLTLVDNCSVDHIRDILGIFQARFPNITTLRLEQPCQSAGQLRNLGAWWAERRHARGDYLYFSGADAFFLNGW